MTEDIQIKCSYFNSGYCKYTRKENGCNFYHPTEPCKLLKCKDKECQYRHQKKCKHGEKCRFQKRCEYLHLDEELGKENTSIQEIIDLNREITILKEDIFQIRKDNEMKVNTLAKVHLKEIEDINVQNKEYLVELTELRKENNELKQSLQTFEEFCDTTLALKDEQIKQTNIANNSQINKLKKENTQSLIMKEEETKEHKNKYEECKTKLDKYVEMAKQGIKVKETDKTTLILNSDGEELGCLDWKNYMRIAMKLVNSCDLCDYGHNFRKYVETHMEQKHPEKSKIPITPNQIQ